MKLIVAKKEHLPEIMELIEQAKAFLKGRGVDQWQNGYPDQSCIEKDIEKESGYLCSIEDKIIEYPCIDFGGEPAYDTINGNWLSSKPYVVVHRMALDNNVKGKGLASAVFQLVEKLSREKGIHSFKVDTDNDNHIMKHILQKNGFQYCGTILFDNSEKIAYEKLI